MKSALIYIITIFLSIAMLQACSSEEPEVEQTPEAIEDSLNQANEAEMEQMRQDSIARAREDSLATTSERESQDNQIEYSENGDFVVQIEAWRSEEKAQQQADQWIDRGFEQAYVVSYGDEDSGDMWFRVRIGQFETREMAERLQNRVEEDYDAESWVSMTGQPVEEEAMQSN